MERVKHKNSFVEQQYFGNICFFFLFFLVCYVVFGIVAINGQWTIVVHIALSNPTDDGRRTTQKRAVNVCWTIMSPT